MKKTQITITVLLISLMAISLVSSLDINIINSSSDVKTSNIPDNFIGRFWSNIKFSIFDTGTFTTYGKILGCSDNPDDYSFFTKGFLGLNPQTLILSAEPGEAFFVNYYRGSPYDEDYAGEDCTEHACETNARQYLGEEFVQYGTDYDSFTFTCDAGGYWDYKCYAEIYYCPLPCYSDSDCSQNAVCDKSVLSTEIPDAGVCLPENFTYEHETPVYRCENGVKEAEGTAIYGDENFCPDPQETKYLTGTTGSCLSSEPSVCFESIDTGTIDSITWTNFFSMNDEDFSQEVKNCKTDNQCKELEDYEVSCTNEELFLERQYEITRAACDAKLGWIDDISDFLQNIGGGLLPNNLCQSWSENYNDFKDYFTGGGYCIAESTTWYGKIWDSTLKIIGGTGIPIQYVIISTILFAVGLLLILMKVVTG